MQVFCHSLNPAFYCNSIACQSLELAFLDWWTGGESNEVKAKTSGAELRVVKRYYSWENKRPWKTCFNSSARTSVLKSQIGEDPVCIKLGLFPLQQTAAFSKWCRSVLPQTAMRAWSALSSKHRADKQNKTKGSMGLVSLALSDFTSTGCWKVVGLDVMCTSAWCRLKCAGVLSFILLYCFFFCLWVSLWALTTNEYQYTLFISHPLKVILPIAGGSHVTRDVSSNPLSFIFIFIFNYLYIKRSNGEFIYGLNLNHVAFCMSMALVWLKG